MVRVITNNTNPTTPATPATPAVPTTPRVREFDAEDLALANRSNVEACTWKLKLGSTVTVVDAATTKQVARSKSGDLTFVPTPGVTYGFSWNKGESYSRVTAVAPTVSDPRPLPEPFPVARVEIANVRCFESSNEGVTDRQIALARQAADGAPFALRVWWELTGDFTRFQNPAGLTGAAKIVAAGGSLLATIAAQHPRDGTWRMPTTPAAARAAGKRVADALIAAKVPTRGVLLQIFNEIDNSWDKGGFWPAGNWKQALAIAAAFAEPLRAASYVCGSPSYSIHDEFRMREFVEYLVSSKLDTAFDAICCNYYAKSAQPIQPTIEKSMDLLLAFAQPRRLQVWVPECGPQLPYEDKVTKKLVVPSLATRVAQLPSLVAQVSRADVFSLYRMAEHPSWAGQFVLFDSKGQPNPAYRPWLVANQPSEAELVVMRAVNAERVKAGLRPLRFHGRCAEVARRTARAVCRALSGKKVTHDLLVAASRSAAKPGDVRSIGGFSAGPGQSVALLAADAAAWASSPDHRPLLLDPSATDMAAGVERGESPGDAGTEPADFFWCAIG